jgi:hypothetical protein
MDGIILFTMRSSLYGFDNLSGHPYLQAYARSFLPHSANPMLKGFHKYDLLGGSRAGKGGYAPMDVLGLKYMFPDDKVIDWVYRESIGENYEGVPDRPDGYFNALLFYAAYATDYSPGVSDPSKLNLGNTFFCGERALMMTRSSWDQEAMQLNMHTRAANGGHAFSDRNAIMVAGAGRIWSPNGYANFKTAENSVVCIDEKNQNLSSPARVVDFVDTPQATFMVGDAKYCWDWNVKTLDKPKGFYTAEDAQAGRVEVPAGWEPVKQSCNDFAYTKLPFAYLKKPLFEAGHWIKPNGAISPLVRQPNYPVVKAFRTAGLIRGEKPYALIVDDIQKDDQVHHYDWTLGLEYDLQIAKVERKSLSEMDIYLTGSDPEQNGARPKEPVASELAAGSVIPARQPMLLLRVLNCTVAAGQPAAAATIVEKDNLTDTKKYGNIRRLVIPCEAVAPDFKVLLYPHRQGDPVPTTTWNKTRNEVTVSFGQKKDVITFTPGSLGKTNVSVARDGGTPVQVKAEFKPIE